MNSDEQQNDLRAIVEAAVRAAPQGSGPRTVILNIARAIITDGKFGCESKSDSPDAPGRMTITSDWSAELHAAFESIGVPCAVDGEKATILMGDMQKAMLSLPRPSRPLDELPLSAAELKMTVAYADPGRAVPAEVVERASAAVAEVRKPRKPGRISGRTTMERGLKHVLEARADAAVDQRERDSDGGRGA